MAGEVCVVLPNGPCQRCKSKKLGCNLMPQNPKTGKTDRRALSEAELLEFRLKQAEGARAEVKRGKRRARDSPDTREQESSGQAPSPLASLAALGALALDSGGSSAANTPDDSPATFSQPPLPDHPPAPPSAPKPRKISKPSAGKPLPAPCGSSH